MKTRSDASRSRESNSRLRAWCPKRIQGILSLLSLGVFQQYRHKADVHQSVGVSCIFQYFEHGNTNMWGALVSSVYGGDV